MQKQKNGKKAVDWREER